MQQKLCGEIFFLSSVWTGCRPFRRLKLHFLQTAGGAADLEYCIIATLEHIPFGCAVFLFLKRDSSTRYISLGSWCSRPGIAAGSTPFSCTVFSFLKGQFHRIAHFKHLGAAVGPKDCRRVQDCSITIYAPVNLTPRA